MPTGNFGDVYAGYVASRMGLPIDRLVVATNVNDILARTFATGDYETRGVTATSSPSMDIQVSSNFERLLFETCQRDAGKVKALMGSLTQSGRFTVPGAALKEMRALFSADRADEQEVAAEIRAWMREASYCADPHTAVALAVAEKETRDPSVPMVVLSTAHPAKFPDAVLGCLRRDAGVTRLVVGPAEKGRTHHRAAGRSSAGREIRIERVAGGARRSHCMTVEVTRLPSGLSVVTDRMQHLESASLGVWIGAGSRDEQADEHGISHLLEHMAFKGTTKRTARQIAETIEAVGGDLNAATSVELTGYFARVLKADVPLALDVLSDILADPSFDPEELRREQNVITQEIGATEDAPDDLVFDRLQEMAFPNQPIGRSILGTPETVRSFSSKSLRTYLGRNYRAPNMLVAAAGAVDHKQIVEEAEKRFASFTGPDAPAA